MEVRGGGGRGRESETFSPQEDEELLGGAGLSGCGRLAVLLRATEKKILRSAQECTSREREKLREGGVEEGEGTDKQSRLLGACGGAGEEEEANAEGDCLADSEAGVSENTGCREHLDMVEGEEEGEEEENGGLEASEL